MWELNCFLQAKFEVGFPVATVVPCRSCLNSHCCATYLMLMDKISRADDKHSYLRI